MITAGLMRLMRNEDELAGVLAHEIAHVVKKHHVKAIKKRARASLARDAAAEMVADHLSKNPLVTDALLGAGIGLYASGLDQSDEPAGDLAGTVIAARAGYDPLGLVFVLTTLDSIDTEEPRGSLMFATHPPTRERIDSLVEIADETASEHPGLLLDTRNFSRCRTDCFRRTK